MTPNPYIQIVPGGAALLEIPAHPCAAITLGDDADELARLQNQADNAGLALIRSVSAVPHGTCDGFWCDDPKALKHLRQQNRDWQLIGLAQDRHTAMVMGEAGADLILFGTLAPLVLAGDLDMAQWWAELFEIPCALITDPKGDLNPADFDQPGWPEFFAMTA